MSKNNIYRRGIAGLLAGIVAIPNLLSAPASAEETEKYQYNLFGRNGIELTADNFCSNGNWHTNKSVLFRALIEISMVHLLRKQTSSRE